MKKIISALLVAVFALSFMLIPASADVFNTLDPTGLLTEDEMFALEQLAVDIEVQYGYFAMMCFAENTDGYETILDFGHDLYDSFSDKKYAVIFVDDLSQSLCDFFVSEDYEEYVFTDDVTTAIFNAYNEAETYYLGAVAFYNGVASALENAGIAASEETTAAEEITDAAAGTQGGQQNQACDHNHNADNDADKIVNLLRDIRRNYLNSDSAWRPWSEGNDRAFRDDLWSVMPYG